MNAAYLSPETPPQRQVLDNGAVLLSRPTPDAFGVSVGVIVRSGTRDEVPTQDGISHLVEHMVFKGTSRRSAFELARDMEAIGAYLDAYTTKEHTGYTLKVLPQHLSEACAILAEMLLDSTFPEDQLELEKNVVIDEILSSEDNPDDHVHELFTAKLLGEHPLSRPILGTAESVRGITRDDLKERCAATHRGANVILAVAGAVDDRVLDQVATSFGFPNGSGRPVEDLAATRTPGTWLFPKDLSQQYVEIGIPSVGVTHPDRYAVSLLGSVLGGGMSSRLFQRVREERGLAYTIFSYADFYRDVGTLCTTFSATPANCQESLDLVAQEYERLRAGDLDEAEVEMNKAQLLGSVVLGLEGSMNQMTRLARSEMYYGRFLPLQDILADIDKLTRSDVVRVAREMLDPTHQTLVGHGPIERLQFGG